MSDAVKWALAAAIVIGLITIVLTFPFVSMLPESANQLKTNLDSISNSAGSFLYEARGFVNIFLGGFGMRLLNVLIVYFCTSWILKLTVKITIWVFNFIFK